MLLRGILFLVIGLLTLQTKALGVTESKDSTNLQNEITVKKHIPSKATIYSAVLPGLGQVYNKKYWKVPFIWGGFAGLIYSVNYYNTRLVNFKTAYFDLTDNNSNTRSYETLYPTKDFTVTSNYSQYKTTMISDIADYRRSRDIMIICTMGFYLFNVLDANVNANLLDFDISEDLTFNFEPFMIEPITNSPILGGQITFTF